MFVWCIFVGSLDIIRVSVGYAEAISSSRNMLASELADEGVVNGEEDLACMRTLPGMACFASLLMMMRQSR